MQTVEQIFDAIRALTPVERLRLVERVVRSVTEEAAPPACATWFAGSRTSPRWSRSTSATTAARSIVARTGGFSSGVVFDALHLVAAERVGADLLLTFNLNDFVRLQGQSTPRIVSPSEVAPTA